MVVEPAPVPPAVPELAARPRHVAIIMDGNGRWARRRGLTRPRGHQAGAENIRAVLERLAAHDVPVVTLFAFSTENWGRPRAEVDFLLRLAGRVIDRELSALDEAGVQLRHIGDLSPLPGWLRRRVAAAVERTAGNRRLVVNLAFNYGGQADIVAAVRRLVAEGVRPEDVTASAIGARMAMSDLPPPDLLIRTGGERRISNFLIWQAAYAELYFTPTLWPDFGIEEVDEALIEFNRRQRRFGLVSSEPERSNGAHTDAGAFPSDGRAAGLAIPGREPAPSGCGPAFALQDDAAGA